MPYTQRKENLCVSEPKTKTPSPPIIEGHHRQSILSEFRWLSALISWRIKQLEGDSGDLSIPSPPEPSSSAFATMVDRWNLELHDRILLICSLTPHLATGIFDVPLIHPEQRLLKRYPDFGGYVDKHYHNFQPTLQTVLFLLAGRDHDQYLHWSVSLIQKSKLMREQIVKLVATPFADDKSNALHHSVQIEAEYIRYLLSGERPRPDFGVDFPASLISTSLQWDHLILPEQTRIQLNRVMKWMNFHGELQKRDQGMLNRSFPCLFYGSPGTGKTLTAKLIGKTFDLPVFRIDLSMVVSKYIGETEKNLARLFRRAEGKDWILFFDEADVLFGKRTEIKDSNDKWANLEVSYLLQKMEEYEGLVILATNLKENLDSALTRRFQAIINFPKPGKSEQQTLWYSLLPSTFSYADGVNFEEWSNHSFTGANISNIIKQVCLDAVAEESDVILREYLMYAIREELRKENRTR